MDNKSLEEFVKDYKLNRKQGITVVNSQDIIELKSQGHSVEELLDYLNNSCQSLFHGSRADFEPAIRPSALSREKSEMYKSDNAISATPFGAIALLKAILSNENANLSYPMDLYPDKRLVVDIEGLNEHTIGEKGYVYVINNIRGFVNEIEFRPIELIQRVNPKYRIEWIRPGKESIIYNAKICVDRLDFKYDIIDKATGKIIK